jgi:hypothetical protein
MNQEAFIAIQWEKGQEGVKYEGWRFYQDDDDKNYRSFTTTWSKTILVACNKQNCKCSVGIRQITDDGASPITYYKEDRNETSASSCAICLSPLDIGRDECVTMPGGCLHLFHVGCLTQWANKEPSCPLCKIPFTTTMRCGAPAQIKKANESHPAPKVT